MDNDTFCTDLGTAQMFTGAGSELAVVGFFTTPGSSLTLIVENPAVGTFDLTQSGAEHEGFYASDNDINYTADRNEGSGSITLTTLTNTRAVGTFDFVGVGADLNGNPAGTKRIRGSFDFAITAASF